MGWVPYRCEANKMSRLLVPAWEAVLMTPSSIVTGSMAFALLLLTKMMSPYSFLVFRFSLPARVAGKGSRPFE